MFQYLKDTNFIIMKLVNAAVISMALGGMALPLYQINPAVAKTLQQDPPHLQHDTGAFGGLYQDGIISGRPLSQRAEPQKDLLKLEQETDGLGGLSQYGIASGRPLLPRAEPHILELEHDTTAFTGPKVPKQWLEKRMFVPSLPGGFQHMYACARNVLAGRCCGVCPNPSIQELNKAVA